MGLGEVAQLVGPFGAPILIPACLCAVTVFARTRWALWICVPLAWIAGIAWLRFWYLWGQAFDLADAYQTVPHSLDRAQDLAMYVCSAAVLATVSISVATLAIAGSHRLVATAPTSAA